jgi:hypothetical protein
LKKTVMWGGDSGSSVCVGGGTWENIRVLKFQPTGVWVITS